MEFGYFTVSARHNRRSQDVDRCELAEKFSRGIRSAPEGQVMLRPLAYGLWWGLLCGMPLSQGLALLGRCPILSTCYYYASSLLTQQEREEVLRRELGENWKNTFDIEKIVK